MLTTQRIIFSDNGTLNDYSYELSDYRASVPIIPFVAAEDYIFVGSQLPFNNKFFDLSVVNAETSDISIDIWFGNAWVSAVDLIDTTASSGVSLAQDGHVIFNTNRLKGWDHEQDSDDVTGLSGTAIYNMYWIRISFSVNLTAGLAINYIGQKFATDDQMFDYYPDLNNTDLMAAFESGKTDWNVQHFMAAQNIIRDLKRQGVILSSDQLLDYQLFEDAAIHKAATLIFAGLGNSYSENMRDAKAAYKDALKVGFFKKDVNADGRINPVEQGLTEGWLSR